MQEAKQTFHSEPLSTCIFIYNYSYFILVALGQEWYMFQKIWNRMKCIHAGIYGGWTSKPTSTVAQSFGGTGAQAKEAFACKEADERRELWFQTFHAPESDDRPYVLNQRHSRDSAQCECEQILTCHIMSSIRHCPSAKCLSWAVALVAIVTNQ